MVRGSAITWVWFRFRWGNWLVNWCLRWRNWLVVWISVMLLLYRSCTIFRTWGWFISIRCSITSRWWACIKSPVRATSTSITSPTAFLGHFAHLPMINGWLLVWTVVGIILVGWCWIIMAGARSVSIHLTLVYHASNAIHRMRASMMIVKGIVGIVTIVNRLK